VPTTRAWRSGRAVDDDRIWQFVTHDAEQVAAHDRRRVVVDCAGVDALCEASQRAAGDGPTEHGPRRVATEHDLGPDARHGAPPSQNVDHRRVERSTFGMLMGI